MHTPNFISDADADLVAYLTAAWAGTPIDSIERVDAERNLQRAVHVAFDPTGGASVPRALRLPSMPEQLIVVLPIGQELTFGVGADQRVASVLDLAVVVVPPG